MFQAKVAAALQNSEAKYPMPKALLLGAYGRQVARQPGDGALLRRGNGPWTPSVRLLPALMLYIWASVSPAALFTDDLGRRVALERTPQRIVALAPSVTETLYFLGLGERVVGVTEFSSYPPEAAQRPKVGSYVNLNPERIIGLAPDLAIATADGNPPAVLDLLTRAGVPVFILDPRNIRQVVETLIRVGELCGVRDRASTLAGELSQRIDRVVAKTAGRDKPVVFLQVNLKPIMAANKDTFLHDLIRLAGGLNMTRDEPATYPRIGLEAVIRGRPEVILISSMARNGAFAEARRQWLKWPLIPAVKNGRVHLIDSDLTDRASPRIVRGLEILARHIHPDAGWDDPEPQAAR